MTDRSRSQRKPGIRVALVALGVATLMLSPPPFIPNTVQAIHGPVESFDGSSGLPPGWTATGLWHVTSHRQRTSGTNSVWYGQEATGNFNTGGPNSGSLISPTITITSLPHPLAFNTWYDAESTGPADIKRVDFSTDGGTSWTPLSLVHTSGGGQREWKSSAIQVQFLAHQTVKFRFFFDTVDASENDGEGWYLDDIRLPTAQAACADGLDNDGDGIVDHWDPGCSAEEDDDETNPPPPFCNDGIDNDGDGLIDYPADPGCTSMLDGNEVNGAQESYTTTHPENLVVTPAYVFLGAPTTVAFTYRSSTNGCSLLTCNPYSEWRIVTGGSVQNGEAAHLDGTVIRSGYAPFTTFTTIPTAVAEEILVRSTTNVKIATRPVYSEDNALWRVVTRQVVVMSSNDTDNDLVADALESEICGRQVERDVINALGGTAGSCPAFNNYIPPYRDVVITIPSGTSVGIDMDADDFPPYIDVYSTKVFITSRGDSMVVPAPKERHVIDVDDSNPNVPLIRVVCAPMSTPSGIGAGPDVDGDNLPAYIRVMRSQVCWDRTVVVTSMNPTADYQQIPVDPNDNSALIPAPPPPPGIPDPIIVDVITNASFSEDADRDGIPGYAYFGHSEFKYRPSRPDQLPAERRYVEVRTLDPADNNRNDPVPYTLVDADGDYIPDASESTLCSLEKQGDPIDGECTSPGQYVPPSWYQMVLRTVGL